MPSTSLPVTRPNAAEADAVVRIRELSPGGMDVVARLAAIERTVWTRPWSAAQLAASGNAPGALTLVAEAADNGGGGAGGAFSAVVGFAVFQVAADEAELLRIAVHPSRQQQGIGWRLLEAGLRQLQRQGVRRVFLEVARDNRAAIALYHGSGFRETGVRKSYYEASGTDALLMCCEPAAV
ncbi:MAG: ribosomal protein S18-alanine N-acetyltransferase [Deltaproteobacteria bacterium]|nr:ribosomal protein S18-alanine N-acetyltransferase [Candidatus Anaeroferrophillacea bacterium]